jgi:hypothetical protein
VEKGVTTMRRLLLFGLAFLLTVSNTGCLLNMYSADPNERMQQLLNQSENLRQAKKEWFRFWLVDQPSHLTPDRVDGRLAP